MGTDIQLQTDVGENRAYLSLPKNEAGNNSSGPGLVILSEWWGLVDHIREVADRFAQAGFVVLAPDLFDGSTTESPHEAGRQMMSLELAKASTTVRAAAEHLHSIDAVTPKRVAVLGFCMGGQLALSAGCDHSDVIQAVVDFYGIHPSVKPDLKKLQCPVLAHFGEHDDFVPREEAERLITAIKSAEKNVDAHFYPAGHAFFNNHRPEAFHEPSAVEAFDRTCTFLRENLGT